MSTTVYMNLTLPEVGTTDSYNAALQLDAALNVIDAHTHTSGSGQAITPAAININAALSMNSQDLTNANTLGLSTQSGTLSSTYLNSLYSVSGNLYYNDGISGTPIQLTIGGSIAGTTGSIAGLVSPASASYVPATKTFAWEASSGVAANMDHASMILRYPGSYPAPSGNYIMVRAPSTLATGYNFTLPATTPSATSVITMDTSGTLGTQNANFLLPSGVILPFAGVSVPTGFLACDGSSVSRTTYADLFAAIGTTWGSVDGSHFNVPDMRRRTPVGSGGTGTTTLANSVGAVGGEESTRLSTNQMPSHLHTFNVNSSSSSASHNHTVNTVRSDGSGSSSGLVYTDTGSSPGSGITTNASSSTSHNHGVSGSTAYEGGSDPSIGLSYPHNTIQPSAVVNYIIKI